MTVEYPLSRFGYILAAITAYYKVTDIITASLSATFLQVSYKSHRVLHNVLMLRW